MSIRLILIILILLGLLTLNFKEFFKEMKYNPNDFTAYRRNISEDIMKKELNRDFNYEVPLFYRTLFKIRLSRFIDRR